ncbi:MAG: amidohydrolase family protein [Treponema sp.]|nr:amidohydrolase family protein [Treponema sp.]
MEEKSFVLRGDILWSAEPRRITTLENAYLVCLEGRSEGVFKELPREYAQLPLREHRGKLIIPGLTDLHVHAPQFAFRALGMDKPLLAWLEEKTFPEEGRYHDLAYAREAYTRFVEEVKRGPNTRLCVLATIHGPGSLLLMELLEESGLVSLVGKLSMDRNCPPYLMEENSEGALREWLDAYTQRRAQGGLANTGAILSPRFFPSCSEGSLKALAEIQREEGLPLQSHLSESRDEITWVRELCPQSPHYAGAYEDMGLLKGPTIMAHCVWPEEKEMDLLAQRGVHIAHCPQANMNLASGIAPVRQLLERGIPLGLGSDVAAGTETSIFRAMTDAIQVSKLRSLSFPQERPLSLEEAFYLGTAGGASFFNKLGTMGGRDFAPQKAGSFEQGWDLDALIIDDSSLVGGTTLPLLERLERVIYLSDDRHITEKYVRGKSILP